MSHNILDKSSIVPPSYVYYEALNACFVLISSLLINELLSSVDIL